MVLCGTSGWTRPDWTGVIYPSRPSRGFYALEFLAHHLDSIEVDQSFLRPLRPEVSRLWLRKVEHNPRFRFVVQLGRSFTFDRDLGPARVREFSDGMRPLARAGRLGCLLLRFPWSFRFTKENRDFFIEIRRAFHEFPMVAELRHSSWTLDEALGTLMDYRVGFCNVDQPQGVRAAPPSAIVTAPVGYVRLLGRAGSDWTDDAAAGAYLYTPAELGEWSSRIERIARHTASTFVIAANSVAGKSAINALQLRSIMADAAPAPRKSVSEPRTLVSAA